LTFGDPFLDSGVVLRFLFREPLQSEEGTRYKILGNERSRQIMALTVFYVPYCLGTGGRRSRDTSLPVPPPHIPLNLNPGFSTLDP